MIISYIEIDINGYRICDAPFASGDEPNIAPHIALDSSTPDGMRKARYVDGSWIDEEAIQLAADISAKNISNVENAIDMMLLQEVINKGYNSIESCLGYIGSTNLQWDAEGTYFKQRKTQIWEYVITELAEVELGNRALPTPEDAVLEIQTMFPLSWP